MEKNIVEKPVANNGYALGGKTSLPAGRQVRLMDYGNENGSVSKRTIKVKNPARI